LNVKSIKTVSAKKTGIMNSIFNEGKVEILCEGSQNGKLVVEYVANPERIKIRIDNMISSLSTQFAVI